MTASALPADTEFINFGELPEKVNEILQLGVVAYRRDRPAADRLFRQALALAPDQLPTYYCLYKIHTYQGNLDEAVGIALAALREAARQAGWDSDYAKWPCCMSSPEEAPRFGLYTLKALAFIHLRRGERDKARHVLDKLSYLDPSGNVGWTVIADLLQGLG